MYLVLGYNPVRNAMGKTSTNHPGIPTNGRSGGSGF